ncbi:hypothetical protein ACIO6U_13425 [Streptomyces sp. NPDC087422]|uniref:hypothetical protein n=1 Tax=Streptomyces sp. NPDC087422 TaxID=3365786 RepID=UPI003806A4A7
MKLLTQHRDQLDHECWLAGDLWGDTSSLRRPESRSTPTPTATRWRSYLRLLGFVMGACMTPATPWAEIKPISSARMRRRYRRLA